MRMYYEGVALNIRYVYNPEYISSFELLLLLNNYLKKEYIFSYMFHQNIKGLTKNIHKS